jgi:hypothetical protein
MHSRISKAVREAQEGRNCKARAKPCVKLMLVVTAVLLVMHALGSFDTLDEALVEGPAPAMEMTTHTH